MKSIDELAEQSVSDVTRIMKTENGKKVPTALVYLTALDYIFAGY